jgi:hypothetical protein
LISSAVVYKCCIVDECAVAAERHQSIARAQSGIHILVLVYLYNYCSIKSSV